MHHNTVKAHCRWNIFSYGLYCIFISAIGMTALLFIWINITYSRLIAQGGMPAAKEFTVIGHGGWPAYMAMVLNVLTSIFAMIEIIRNQGRFRVVAIIVFATALWAAFMLYLVQLGHWWLYDYCVYG